MLKPGDDAPDFSLEDQSGEMVTLSSKYGAERPGPLLNRRVTLVIDRNQKVVKAISSELNMNGHADRALKALAALVGSA